ncbi:MAG: permease [Thermodesulfobacteriota bacterium]
MHQTTAEKKKIPLPSTSFLIFAAITFIAGAICYSRGRGVFLKGLDASLSMLLLVVPRVIAAFLMAGFIQVLIPTGMIQKWIGEKSGFKGIVIASLAGVFTPGGPMISFPLIAALYKLGANCGPLVAYLISWEILGLQRIIVWEIPFMGVKFAILKFMISIPLPLLAGLTAQKLMLHVGASFHGKEGE